MRHFPALGPVFLLYGLICLASIFFLSGFHVVQPLHDMDRPDFAAIEDSAARKLAFFDFLTPLIEDQNQRILKVRERLLSIQAQFEQSGEFSRRDQYYIKSWVRTYRFADEELSTEEQLTRLLRRVDIIPVAMALAQAASESGWGSSRFAQTANNFFGQWCYVAGCGIIPNQRSDDERHEVAKFNSVAASVRSYFYNINTHKAYQKFRQRRQQLRDAGKELYSKDLIPTLIFYSERRQEYLDDLYQIIRVNNLSTLEQP